MFQPHLVSETPHRQRLPAVDFVGSRTGNYSRDSSRTKLHKADPLQRALKPICQSSHRLSFFYSTQLHQHTHQESARGPFFVRPRQSFTSFSHSFCHSLCHRAPPLDSTSVRNKAKLSVSGISLLALNLLHHLSVPCTTTTTTTTTFPALQLCLCLSVFTITLLYILVIPCSSTSAAASLLVPWTSPLPLPLLFLRSFPVRYNTRT